MFDLISIGNISIDLYFKGSSLTFEKDRFQLAIGGKYFVDQFHTGIGGGGVNVAIGVAKEGIKSAVMGTIGNNPFKKMILQLLEAKQVSSKLCFWSLSLDAGGSFSSFSYWVIRPFTSFFRGKKK